MVDMEVAIKVQIEHLPEGLYLAASNDFPGLVAQGAPWRKRWRFARDVAKKLIEARHERETMPDLQTAGDLRDYLIVVGA